MTNKINTVLYVGVTNDLVRRVSEHKNNLADSFTKRYKIYKLVYYETTTDVREAVSREKQLKRWRRDKKNELINSVNPEWNDIEL